MLIAEVIAPASKLAFARALRTERPPAPWVHCSGSGRATRTTCIGDGLGAGPQGPSKRLGRPALADGTLVL